MGKLRWVNGQCERGHDITDPANVGTRAGKRFCACCEHDRYDAMRHPVRPWPGDHCDAGHEVRYTTQILKRKLDGIWTYICKTCAQADEGTAAPGHQEFSLPEPWMKLGICAGADFTRFFSGVAVARETAADYCHDCPVLAACGQFADRLKLDGLWGGVYRLSSSGKYTKMALLRIIT